MNDLLLCSISTIYLPSLGLYSQTQPSVRQDGWLHVLNLFIPMKQNKTKNSVYVMLERHSIIVHDYFEETEGKRKQNDKEKRSNVIQRKQQPQPRNKTHDGITLGSWVQSTYVGRNR
ncbi:hypothetical protein FPOAC2_07064 [Fusarium poae]